MTFSLFTRGIEQQVRETPCFLRSRKGGERSFFVERQLSPHSPKHVSTTKKMTHLPKLFGHGSRFQNPPPNPRPEHATKHSSCCVSLTEDANACQKFVVRFSPANLLHSPQPTPPRSPPPPRLSPDGTRVRRCCAGRIGRPPTRVEIATSTFQAGVHTPSYCWARR